MGAWRTLKEKMDVPRACLVLVLVAAGAVSAAEPPAETLTWQEANKRSAALVKEKGASTVAADLARTAFDLYPQQTKSYNATNHAQLLLNLADVRYKADGREAATKEINRGTEAITKFAGPKADVLIAVWQEAARLAGRGTREAGRYNQQALARAEEVLGPDDPRTISLLLDVVYDLRATEKYIWAVSKYQMARERAAKSGEDNPLVTQIDLSLAKLDLEHDNRSAAAEKYRALIDRLEKRTQTDQEAYLHAAYAQLEYAYTEKGDKEAAEEIRRLRSKRLRGEDEGLIPLMRSQPEYPRSALAKRQRGFVEMHLRVGPDGSVLDVTVVRSEPEGVFDESAVKAVRKWKFKPKVVGGQPVETAGKQLIEYNLVDRGYEFRRGSK